MENYLVMKRKEEWQLLNLCQVEKKMMDGGVVNHAQLTGFGAVRPEVKKFGK